MEATSLPRARAFALPRRVLAALDDERLVERLRHGDEAAFEVIYDRHHRGILSYCRHLLGSREEAEDAVQHVFASAYRALLADDREISLRAWLYTIARNRCLSVLRARREQPGEIDEVAVDGLSDAVQRRDDLRALLADLRDLPEPQRAALVLAEVSGLGHAEIAAVLGCEVAKVKSLVYQARSGLIERRQARETPCEEIREQLAVLRGGSLRRGPLRRHLKACPGCAAYREEVRRQRRMLAIALPVLPSAGLKDGVLAAAGFGGTGAAGGAAAGGAAVSAGAAGSAGAISGGGGVLAAKAGLAKIAAVLAAGGAAAGGGTYAVTRDAGEREPAAAPAHAAPATPATAPGPGAPANVDARGDDRAERGLRARGPAGEGPVAGRSREGARRADRGRRSRPGPPAAVTPRLTRPGRPERRGGPPRRPAKPERDRRARPPRARPPRPAPPRAQAPRGRAAPEAAPPPAPPRERPQREPAEPAG